MIRASDLASDKDDLFAIGHAAIGLVTGAIALAIVAVLLSSGSQTTQVINTAFAFLSWLVSQVVKPLGAGPHVALSNVSLPAGGYGMIGGNGQALSGAATPATGTPSTTGGTSATAGVDTGGWDFSGLAPGGIGGTGGTSGTGTSGLSQTYFPGSTYGSADAGKTFGYALPAYFGI